MSGLQRLWLGLTRKKAFESNPCLGDLSITPHDEVRDTQFGLIRARGKQCRIEPRIGLERPLS